MASRIQLKKGLEIPIAGPPEQVISSGRPLTSVALSCTDFLGLKPHILVKPGDAVGMGEPMFLNKHDRAVQFTSPASGRVVAVNRGRRRILQSVVIELDEAAAMEKTFASVQQQDRTAIRDLLLQSGSWASFRTRPYNCVPNSNSSPCSLFITAIDTRPMAADPQVVIADRLEQFSTGIQVVAGLGEGPVYLCTGPNWSGPDPADNKIQRIEFAGPHPAGLPGTHIHFLDPVSADHMVWHIDYQDVIAIGHLFMTGRLLNERVVSVAGPGMLKPRLLRTLGGANITELLEGELVLNQPCRIISGSVLDGFAVSGPSCFLGRYDKQVSVISDPVELKKFRWFGRKKTTEKKSAHPSVSSHNRQQPLELSVSRNSRQLTLIPTERFERVMPLDILPAPLLQALLIKDTDTAQALGCLELAKEDLALCSYVCPARQDYGAALQINLEQIEKEG